MHIMQQTYSETLSYFYSYQDYVSFTQSCTGVAIMK